MVHFIPDLKVGVFVTLRAPDVIRSPTAPGAKKRVEIKDRIIALDHRFFGKPAIKYLTKDLNTDTY